MRPIILSLAICLALFSCEKPETIDPGALLECHQSQQLDSAAISTKLVGTWSFSSGFCYKKKLTNPLTIGKANFSDNGRFTVADFNGSVRQGTWNLKSLGSNMWGLEMTPQSEYLYGRIVFCKNQVLFDNTDVNGEGCYHLFSK
jgi:hypothetical protein